MAKAEDKKYLALWKQYRENTDKATPVDLNESPVAKTKAYCSFRERSRSMV